MNVFNITKIIFYEIESDKKTPTEMKIFLCEVLFDQ